MPETTNVAVRAERFTYTQDDHEAVYQAYAVMEKPSVRKAAEACGVSHRTAELWCAQENWVERRAGEQLERVAAIRARIEQVLLDNATAVTRRAVELAMQDDHLPTAARMVIHIQGLLGYSPVTKTASIVQHIGDAGSGSSGDTPLPLAELIESFNARLAALGAPSPPQDISEDDERMRTGGVPPEAGASSSDSGEASEEEMFSDSLSSGGDSRGGDDSGRVVEAAWIPGDE